VTCPICSDHTAKSTGLGTFDQRVEIDCPRCGSFIASDDFVGSRPGNLTPAQIGNASGWIHENQKITLQSKDWDFLKSLSTPGVGEKAEKLLLYFAREYPQPNQHLSFSGLGEDISACWAANRDEASYLFHRYLIGYKSFIHQLDIGGHPFIISPAGWDYLHTLRHASTDSKIGFCAMWFDKRLEPLWNNAIRPAIDGAGYDPKRIDKIEHNNKIDDEIVALIRRSRFVIADYTGNRGGVYFEAGFAMGLGIPVIWTCRDGRLGKVHFDTRQYNFVTWDKEHLPDFRKRLQSRIEATIP
jgi:hypothetical protein